MYGLSPNALKSMRDINRQLIAIKNQQRYDDETMAALEGALVDPLRDPDPLAADTVWRAALALVGIDRSHGCADPEWAKRCIDKAHGEAATRLRRALQIVDATRADGLWPSGQVRLASLVAQLQLWGVGQSVGSSPVPKRVPAHRAQEQAILAQLRIMGLDPQRLPTPPSGKVCPVKQAVLKALGYSPEVMRKAWLRLRADKAIRSVD